MWSQRILALVLAVLITPAIPGDAAQLCIGCPVTIPEKTRITVGDWHIDLVIGAGVSKEDAEILVRAGRRNEIADKFDAKGNGSRPIDIATIVAIYPSSFFSPSTPWLGVPESGVRYYEMVAPADSFTSAWHHVVGIRSDGRVERVGIIHVTA